MSPAFTPDLRYQVEQYVGRELTSDELVAVPSVSDLAPAHKAIVHDLAVQHRLVARIYLCGVVEGLLSTEAMAMIDAIRDEAGL